MDAAFNPPDVHKIVSLLDITHTGESGVECTHSTDHIDNGGGAVRFLGVVQSGLLTDQRPQLVQVDGGAEDGVPLQVVVPHTHLPKVPWVIFIEVDAVVVHATSITATSRVFSVLTHTAVSMAHMTTELPGLRSPSRLK